MTEEHIFVDSSAFLAFFVDGVDVFERIDALLVTSTNVIEEVVYVLVKIKASDVTGIEKHYDLLCHLRENPNITVEIAKEVISDVSSVLDYWEIKVLPPATYQEMFDAITAYGLLPNDALIAATCKHYGIKKIATFDDDFKKVDFLEIVDIK
ncbi:type II toxin-antitoxin system VapC family toxin [Geoglobus ahangari]